MKYRISLSLVLATSLLLSSTVATAQEDNANKSTEETKNKNTSKAIDFEKRSKNESTGFERSVNTRGFEAT
ncbi:MAG: hypothetical protein ACTH27_12685 [Staphylococcus equorum]